MDGRHDEDEEDDYGEDVFKWDKTDSDCKLPELVNFTSDLTNQHGVATDEVMSDYYYYFALMHAGRLKCFFAYVELNKHGLMCNFLLFCSHCSRGVV